MGSSSNSVNPSVLSDSVAATYDDSMMMGLRLGGGGGGLEEISSFSNVPMSRVPIPSTPTKRSRASSQNMQNPCCQVEGCNLDLRPAKEYHRRHRICEAHSKSPRVTVAGMERRFCQQCSRFHDLSEFDDKKRSCRRRLSDHNARRRKVHPESVQLSSSGLSSSLYDQRRINLPLNGLPLSLSNSSTWENANASMFRHGLIRSSMSGGHDGPPCLSGDELHESIFELHNDLDNPSSIPSSNPRGLDQCLQIPMIDSPVATDMVNPHSLPSSNSWSLDDGESGSMDHSLVHVPHGSYIMRKSNSEPHRLSLFEAFNVAMEQGEAVTMVHSVNEGTSNQHEYQLFKTPYDPTSRFC